MFIQAETTFLVSAIALAALITSLILALGHWLPWRAILGKKLGRIQSYIYGVMAISIPLSFVFIILHDFEALAALWAVAVAGGATTIGCYLVDWTLEKRLRAKEAEEREAQLLKRVNDVPVE
jgi:hypothetical protein